jgi:hypothetical protein
MPERARTICRHCGKATDGRCCIGKYNADRYRNDPIERLYRSPEWFAFRAFIRVRNPQCQRIEKGVRCQKPSTDLHHLISPRVDISLFLVPTNVAMVCAHHHPAGTIGTPHWREGVDYVPTVATINEF